MRTSRSANAALKTHARLTTFIPRGEHRASPEASIVKKRTTAKVALTKQIREIQRKMNHRYGTPLVARELARRERSVGHNRVARILREKGLGARPKRRFRATTEVCAEREEV